MGGLNGGFALTQPPGPPPGWYPDPSGRSRLRYFDGNAWTGHYAPMPVVSTDNPPPPTGPPVGTAYPVPPVVSVSPDEAAKRSRNNVTYLTVAAAVVVIVIIIIGISARHGQFTNESGSSTSTRASYVETADDTAFLAKLDALNIPYTSRHDAVLEGKAVCLFLDVNENAEVSDAAREVRDGDYLDLSGLSDFHRNLKALGFVLAATAVYCPQHKPR